MSYSITCSTRILTLAIAPFLFISVGILCEFAMALDVYILLTLRKKGAHFFMRDRCKNSAAYSSKRFKPLSAIILLWQGYFWVKKNTKEFHCDMMLIIRLTSTLQYYFFGFQWMSLSNLFLTKFLKFVATYFGCGC